MLISVKQSELNKLKFFAKVELSMQIYQVKANTSFALRIMQNGQSYKKLAL